MREITRYLAKIKCRLLPGHPDLKEWTPEKANFEFEDIYRFDSVFYPPSETEMMHEYMKRDLALVAGGGHNTDYISCPFYEFKRITEAQEKEWKEATA